MQLLQHEQSVSGSRIVTCSRRRRIQILASRVFDSEAATFRTDQVVTVSRVTGLICSAGPIDPAVNYLANNDADVIDLRSEKIALLPGFIDAHVHMFLHPYAETPWVDQVTKESTAERVIRATAHARNTLMAGFTAVRDLGTEGAEDADQALRKCISSPASVIPGPRLFTATRAIAATGSYGPKGDIRPDAEGVNGKIGAEAADGKEECRKVVRRQIGAGAEWIKIYADYPFRSRLGAVSPKTADQNLPLFTKKELRTMVETAHALNVKVAAHAVSTLTVYDLASVYVDSIEHGIFMDENGLENLSGNSSFVTWVPTLATFSRHGPYSTLWRQAKTTFQKALEIGGISIACGGDTGTFAHGANLLELLCMIELGAEWHEALKWLTLGGWKCIRGRQWDGEQGERRLTAFAEAAASSLKYDVEEDDKPFKEIDEWPLGDNDVPLGVIKPGFAADLVAVSRDSWMQWEVKGLFGEGEPVASVESHLAGHSIEFVMKGARVYKMKGIEVHDGV